jgi:hypothetical protein
MNLEQVGIIGVEPISVSIALKLKEISAGKGKGAAIHITPPSTPTPRQPISPGHMVHLTKWSASPDRPATMLTW